MGDELTSILTREDKKNLLKILNYFKLSVFRPSAYELEESLQILRGANRPVILSIAHSDGSNGHAVIIIPKRDHSGFTFYDPSGKSIKQLIKMGYKTSKLMELKENLNIDDSNQYNIQEETRDMSSCLKFCVQRYLWQELTNDEFSRGLDMVSTKHTDKDKLVFVIKSINNLATAIQENKVDDTMKRWRAEYVLGRPESNPLLEKGGLILNIKFLTKERLAEQDYVLYEALKRKYDAKTINPTEHEQLNRLMDKIRQREIAELIIPMFKKQLEGQELTEDEKLILPILTETFDELYNKMNKEWEKKIMTGKGLAASYISGGGGGGGGWDRGGGGGGEEQSWRW